jgi:hypothetical protein
VQRIYVGLERDEQRVGRVWVCAENRLAADDDELVVSRHLGGGRDHMLEVLGSQSTDLGEDPASLGLAEHSGEWRVLSKIVAV